MFGSLIDLLVPLFDDFARWWLHRKRKKKLTALIAGWERFIICLENHISPRPIEYRAALEKRMLIDYQGFDNAWVTGETIKLSDLDDRFLSTTITDERLSEFEGDRFYSLMLRVPRRWIRDEDASDLISEYLRLLKTSVVLAGRSWRN